MHHGDSSTSAARPQAKQQITSETDEQMTAEAVNPADFNCLSRVEYLLSKNSSVTHPALHTGSSLHPKED